jgi:hypothetical protein
MFDLTLPPDLTRRCASYLEERLSWFGVGLNLPKGSTRDRQLRAAIAKWWRELPAAEHERVFVCFVKQCLDDLVEKDDMLLEDATPEQLSKAAIDEFQRRVRASTES